MGVLSARSFVAPLIDKRNLIAIVLIAVFFAVYRLSGGSIETNSGVSRSVPRVAPSSNSFFERFTNSEDISPIEDLKRLRQESSEPPTSIKQREKVDLLDEMLVPGDNNSAEPKKSRLDDIERSLGLR